MRSIVGAALGRLLSFVTAKGPALAVVAVDGTTGEPATTDGLTNTQLRASPVPVSGTVTASGPLTDAQLRASRVGVAEAGVPTTIAETQMFSLHTDGTVDGTLGGSASLSGNFSVTPRVLYYTAPAGGRRILSVRMFLFAGAALNQSGWGTAAGTLSNGIRFEVVTANPTNVAQANVWRLLPTGGVDATFIKSNFDLLKACRSEVIGARWNQNIVGILDLPPGGIPLAAGSSFRVIAQDDTSSVTGCRVEVTVGPL